MEESKCPGGAGINDNQFVFLFFFFLPSILFKWRWSTASCCDRLDNTIKKFSFADYNKCKDTSGVLLLPDFRLSEVHSNVSSLMIRALTDHAGIGQCLLHKVLAAFWPTYHVESVIRICCSAKRNTGRENGKKKQIALESAAVLSVISLI